LCPGRHFLCRMNFSKVFVDFSTGFWTYPLLLFWLLCFFSFSPVWVRQWHHKAIANTSKYARWKKLSYNLFLVDVTLAVCDLSQKSCSNVYISASAVPEGFLARVKMPMISVEPPFGEMFFTSPNFFRTQATSWIKQKHSCNVHCLKSYPGMLTLLVCHTNTDLMRISLVSKKILAIFGQGYQRWKFLFFLAIFGPDYQRSNFLFF